MFELSGELKALYSIQVVPIRNSLVDEFDIVMRKIGDSDVSLVVYDAM